MSDSRDIVSDLFSSTCNPLEPSRTPAAKRPTSPGNRNRSKTGGTAKMTTSKTANGTIGSFKTSEIDSIERLVRSLEQGVLKKAKVELPCFREGATSAASLAD